MRWHWQNLSEKWIGKKKVLGSGLRHGRAWFHFGNGEGWDARVLRVEWLLGKLDFDLYVSFNGGEREVLWHIALPFLFSLYIGHNLRWKWLWKKTGYDHWRLGIRVFDWAIWWSGFENEMSMSSKDKWYRRWHFNVRDFVLGQNKYEKVEHSKHRIWIPLPEGQYLAEATYVTATWRRKHWPWWPFKLVREFVDVDVQAWHGLPHEGKGENSWDCGTDGLFGYSSDGHSLEKAIAKGVESTLKSRARYGGSARGAYPDPHITKKAGLKAFAELVATLLKLRVKYPKWGKVLVQQEYDGDIVIIRAVETGESKDHVRAITTTPSLSAQWEETLNKAMQTVVLKDDDSVAEAAST